MIKFITILLSVISIVNCAKCPPKQIVFPCDCGNDVIYCGLKSTRYLKHIFKGMSKYLREDNKSFLILDIKNISIVELEDNIFSGLQFKRIFLRDLQDLKRISTHAFNGTQEYLEELSIEGESKLDTDSNFGELLSAINTLKSLEALYLDSYQLKRFPSYALKNSKISDIDLNFNRLRIGSLKFIDNFAFYHQNDLVDLDLTNQQLDYIPKNAFTFEKQSKEKLSIFLDHNNLNSSSFELGLFNNTNRILNLYLRNNNITFIDEKIFAPFFDKTEENKIDLSENPILLDCRTRWMVNYGSSLYHRILGGVSTSLKKLMFLDENDFKDCK